MNGKDVTQTNKMSEVESPGQDFYGPLNADSWNALTDYFANLPNRIMLHVWGDPEGSTGEREAARLAKGLESAFETISTTLLPRRIDYPYYPIIGVLGFDEEEAVVDPGIRLIGLPAGVQLTSLIAAIQAVSFRGSTLEVKTRIQLHDLRHDVVLELLSSADDEPGTLVAKTIFGLAVASKHVRAYLIMADVFPEALWRYSVSRVPHLVVNQRVHAGGFLTEEQVLKQIASAVVDS
jgi:alkyl hydroperoxide reductase subunit AhpF